MKWTLLHLLQLHLTYTLTNAVFMETKGATGCRDGWHQKEKKCYKLQVYNDLDLDRSWTRARVTCMKGGGDLISITSQSIQLYVDKLLEREGLTKDRFYWIGLWDIKNEGHFLWVTGDNVTYDNWNHGEPHSHNPTEPQSSTENYVVVSGNKKWNDVPDTWSAILRGKKEPSAFICQTGVDPGLAVANDQEQLQSGIVNRISRGLPGIPGPPGPPGPPTKTRGPPGPPGIQGSKGDKGDRGLQGPPGLPPIRVTNPPGVRGPAGPPGRQGIPGDKGQKGQKGDRGDKGLTGELGSPGRQGSSGSPGRHGVDGRPGADGSKGPLGERGPKGPPGERGLQGLSGLKGPMGDLGPRGEKGIRGDQGAPGRPGLPGESGDQGPTGLPGHIGQPGSPGNPGPDGWPGPSGAKGLRGDTGPPGQLGPTGPSGERGPDGKTGPDGKQGPVGLRGPKGTPGTAGLKGIPGDKGPSGDPGIAGPPGQPGPPGPPGPPGAIVRAHEDDAADEVNSGDNTDVDAPKNSWKLSSTFLNASAFCRGRPNGVYNHPLHCWQFVTCGSPFGGDHELTCYSGRRFRPERSECVQDKTCIFGAPSNSVWPKAMRMQSSSDQTSSNTSELVHTQYINKTQKRHPMTVYATGIAILFLLVSVLSIAVCRLYVRPPVVRAFPSLSSVSQGLDNSII